MNDKAINSDEEDGMGFSGLIPSSQEKLDEIRQKQSAIAQAKYHELIMAVCRKFPGESRHETALRYIREVEARAVSDTGCVNS